MKNSTAHAKPKTFSPSWRRIDFVLGRLSTLYGSDHVSQQKALQIERRLELVLLSSLAATKTPESQFIGGAFELIESGKASSKPCVKK